MKRLTVPEDVLVLNDVDSTEFCKMLFSSPHQTGYLTLTGKYPARKYTRLIAKNAKIESTIHKINVPLFVRETKFNDGAISIALNGIAFSSTSEFRFFELFNDQGYLFEDINFID